MATLSNQTKQRLNAFLDSTDLAVAVEAASTSGGTPLGPTTTSVTSAATLALPTVGPFAATTLLTVTGSASIASITGRGVGTLLVLTWNGTAKLTNGAPITVPGGFELAPTTGDRVLLYSPALDVWQVLLHVQADGRTDYDVLSTSATGLVHYPHTVYSMAAGLVGAGFGNGGVIAQLGNVTAPGHVAGLIGRARQISGTSDASYGVEGRVDAEGSGAVITRGICYPAITGTDTDNLGTMTQLVGLFMPNYSNGQYTRVLNKLLMLCDDPNANVLLSGRIIGALGRLLNAGSLTTYAGGELTPAAHSGMKTLTSYGSSMVLTATPTALVANLMYYSDVFVSERSTLASFRVDVTTGAASSNLRVGLYAWSRGSLVKVAEGTPVSSAASGIKTLAVTGSIVVDPGQYMLAVLSDGAPTIKFINNYNIGGIIGVSATLDDDTLMLTSQAYGVMPTNPTFTRNANATCVLPRLSLQVV